MVIPRAWRCAEGHRCNGHPSGVEVCWGPQVFPPDGRHGGLVSWRHRCHPHVVSFGEGISSLNFAQPRSPPHFPSPNVTFPPAFFTPPPHTGDSPCVSANMHLDIHTHTQIFCLVWLLSLSLSLSPFLSFSFLSLLCLSFAPFPLTSIVSQYNTLIYSQNLLLWITTSDRFVAKKKKPWEREGREKKHYSSLYTALWVLYSILSILQ